MIPSDLIEAKKLSDQRWQERHDKATNCPECSKSFTHKSKVYIIDDFYPHEFICPECAKERRFIIRKNLEVSNVKS